MRVSTVYVQECIVYITNTGKSSLNKTGDVNKSYLGPGLLVGNLWCTEIGECCNISCTDNMSFWAE